MNAPAGASSEGCYMYKEFADNASAFGEFLHRYWEPIWFVFFLWSIPNFQDGRYGTFYTILFIVYWVGKHLDVDDDSGDLEPDVPVETSTLTMGIVLGALLFIFMISLSVGQSQTVLGTPAFRSQSTSWMSGELRDILSAGAVAVPENRVFCGVIFGTLCFILTPFLAIPAAGFIAAAFHSNAYGGDMVAFYQCWVVFSTYCAVILVTGSWFALDISHMAYNMIVQAAQFYSITLPFFGVVDWIQTGGR